MEKTDHILRMVYSPEEIALRVSQLSARINQRYAQEPLTVVCVLKGAFMLFADLVRQLKMPVQTDFVRLSSYGGQTFSCREIRLIKDVDCELDGCNVVIVEDIVDTGVTMKHLLETLQARKPKEIRIATLLLKPDKLKVELDIHYVAMRIPNDFIVGYGLDYDGLGRNYRDIYTVME